MDCNFGHLFCPFIHSKGGKLPFIKKFLQFHLFQENFCSLDTFFFDPMSLSRHPSYYIIPVPLMPFLSESTTPRKVVLVMGEWCSLLDVSEVFRTLLGASPIHPELSLLCWWSSQRAWSSYQHIGLPWQHAKYSPTHLAPDHLGKRWRTSAWSGETGYRKRSPFIQPAP